MAEPDPSTCATATANMWFCGRGAEIASRDPRHMRTSLLISLLATTRSAEAALALVSLAPLITRACFSRYRSRRRALRGSTCSWRRRAGAAINRAFCSTAIARVGAVDLTRPEKVAQLEATPGIAVLDLSALRTSDPLNHSKFATSPAVVRLLGDRLIAGQQIDDSDVSAAGAAEAVGNIMAAPIVLFTGGLSN